MSPANPGVVTVSAARRSGGDVTRAIVPDAIAWSRRDRRARARSGPRRSSREHQSPINAPNGDPVFGRVLINPAYANVPAFGEDIAAGYSDAAQGTFAYMYQDSDSGWGYRGNVLGSYNTVGIGVVLNAANSQWGNYWTDDFAQQTALYTPPATADSNAPLMGQVNYSNGTATVTGVADSPQNVNDEGASSLTAGITDVVFYTNNIVDINGDGSAYNTVQATQTPSGTWTAQITVNAGDVLHAVAVDGSGNFTDMSAPASAVTLRAGTNTIALPAARAATSVDKLDHPKRRAGASASRLSPRRAAEAAERVELRKDRHCELSDCASATGERW